MVIGVDLGGTNVRAALVTSGGEIGGPRVEKPSRAREGVAACLDSVADTILEAAAGVEPSSVGIAIPGHIDGLDGVVRWAPNFGTGLGEEFQMWLDVPFTEGLSERIPFRIHIGNDANLAAIGEYRFGSGKRTANGLVLFTLGTGLGSGVVLAPECVHGGLTRATVLFGNGGGAAELGHITIVKDGALCSCGARGHAEAYLGGIGLLTLAAKFGAEGSSPKAIFVAAENGDSSALQTWALFGSYLGIVISCAIHSYGPEIVAIGGQVAKAAKYFLPSAIESAREASVASLFANSRIAVAEKIDDAGILGAGALALEADEA
ncbi:MAG TPA: ROK family protein [Fimbriimonadales bacterium]|nr:ROK family protein [Fimbriimonadales bacterium]